MTDMPTAFDLSDRVAVVSGAGSGIGAGIAEGLAEAGADLVLTGRTAARLEAVAERIQALGRAAHVL
ncbi:SDR family NAD(P)-dependent oxidoreductase, partial [Burkholderia sp. SIMBA_024]|uniref:SDR family NAD(P)-dependent oxidoreductase n=1 Tax=Burkholderia sp. SIMBA_024 TaxID=3085768 RepID=UPI00397D7A41